MPQNSETQSHTSSADVQDIVVGLTNDLLDYYSTCPFVGWHIIVHLLLHPPPPPPQHHLVTARGHLHHHHLSSPVQCRSAPHLAAAADHHRLKKKRRRHYGIWIIVGILAFCSSTTYWAHFKSVHVVDQVEISRDAENFTTKATATRRNGKEFDTKPDLTERHLTFRSHFAIYLEEEVDVALSPILFRIKPQGKEQRINN